MPRTGWELSIEEEARGLERLLPVILALDLRMETAEFSRHAAALLGRIRRMYFQETGALGFLRIAASGVPAPDADRRRLRAEHGAFEAPVERAAEALLVAARALDVRLTAEAMSALAQMIEDETPIRAAVRGMLGSYGGAQLDAAGRRSDAAFILERLDRLAPRFAEAESRMRVHALARGLDMDAMEAAARAEAGATGSAAPDAAQDGTGAGRDGRASSPSLHDAERSRPEAGAAGV